MIAQPIVRLTPDKPVTINLRSEADFFRLYVNQFPASAGQSAAERPSVFQTTTNLTTNLRTPPSRVPEDSLSVFTPVLTFSVTSRSGGNISMAVTNTSQTDAQNVTIWGITQGDANFVYNPSLLVPPFVVPGAVDLKPGATSGFNLFFTGPNPSASFSFIITADADNVPSFTIPINVK